MLTAFFDRDGTISKEYADEIWPTVTEVELKPGAVEALRFLRAKGYEIIIITNQYFIEEGTVTMEQYEDYTKKLLSALKDNGVEIKDIFFCHHARTNPCGCRKPSTGMIEAALRKYPDIDMTRAFMVGDSECDLLLAKSLNIPAYGVRRRIDYDKCVCMDSLMDFEKAFSENRTE